MYELTMLQAQLLWALSVLNLAYLVRYRPLGTSLSNTTEIYNEIFVYASLVLGSVFLNPLLELDVRDAVGWALIAVALGNILGNMALVAYHSGKDIISSV